MGNRNDPPSLSNEARKSGKHQKRRGEHRERPCPNPPKSPANVVLTFKVREAKTHLEYSAKTKWDGVTEDEQGAKIPGQGVEIDHYEVQLQPVNADGTPKETEDGDSRIRRKHKKSVKGIKIIKAEILTGTTTAEYTTKKAHGFVAGERVRIQDIKPNAYNGRHTVLAAGLTADKFRADIGSAPDKLEDEGTVEGEPDPNYNVIWEHISNPRKWFWQTRVRAWDNKNCPSDWSEWTDPALPVQESRPKPPPPAFRGLTFDRKGTKKHNPFRGRVKIMPVTFWDVPGGDQEDDMARYHVKVQVSDDGGATWHKHALLHVRDSDDEKDEDVNILLIFHNVRRRNRYRVWLASSDRYGRKGDYDGPYPSTLGQAVGGTPNQVNNVTVTRPAPRRFKATWDEPSDPEDVDHYLTEWWRRNPLTLMETNRSRNRHDVYRVPEIDKKKAHFVKVYAVDEDNNQSAAQQPADQDETGDFGDPQWEPGDIKKKGHAGVPAGWLLCDGASYSTSLYTALFAAIGYTYGGAGSVFNVPDIRGRHPVGVSSQFALGANENTAENLRNADHAHASDSTNTTPGTDASGSGVNVNDADTTPATDQQPDSGHRHAAGNLSPTLSASAGPASGGSGSPTDLTRQGHTHQIVGLSDFSGDGHRHGHSHGGHRHNHEHGAHGHGHNHGGHGHGHGHDNKRRPHSAHHFIIKT